MAQREVSDEELMQAKLEAVAVVFGDRWWWHRRTLPDGRVLYLLPLCEGNRIGVSAAGDETGFDDVYDYPDVMASWKAALGWDGQGDPEGWVRHCRLGEVPRRRPDGKPESEYRAP